MIPGWLISLITFPGVIFHELAHEFFCRKLSVPVYKVVYFQFGNPAGYVLHGAVKNFNQHFWISVGPFIINSILAIFLCFPVSIQLFDLECYNLPFIYYFLGWVGISLGVNAFPSSADAENLWESSKEYSKKGSIGAIFGFPVAFFIFIANILSVIWFDFFFAIGLVSFAPRLLVSFLK